MLNEKKFCIIMCVNDDDYENESLRYISNLNIPEGYILETLSVREAQSMAEGYNEGMSASDAKFKIYIHQDVFILNRDLLSDLLNIFADESVGMVGMVGSPKMPDDGVMWDGDRVGRIVTCDVRATFDCPFQFDYVEGRLWDVEAVDGLFIATQYDIPWREDLFTGWDFYDVSQGFEMRRAGYRVVVPDQADAWVLHDAGLFALDRYYDYRDIFLREYYEKDSIAESEEYARCRRLSFEIVEKIDEIMSAGTEDRFAQVAELFTPDVINRATSRNADLFTIYMIYDVLSQRDYRQIEPYFADCINTKDIVKKWDLLKFALWEVEYAVSKDAENYLYDLISGYDICNEMLKQLIDTTAVTKDKAYMLLACIFMDHGDIDRAKWMLAAGKIQLR